MPANDAFTQFLRCGGEYPNATALPAGVGTHAKAQQHQLDDIVRWYTDSQSIDETLLHCRDALKEVKFELASFTNDDVDFDWLTGQRDALEHALSWKPDTRY